jgi:ribulose-phosphate 3-epimerase
MTSPYVISASILGSDLTCLGEQIREAEMAGADWIHVDVMDGHFVPNLTFGPVIIEACRKVTQLPLDVHLMVESPENLLASFAAAGSTILSVHIETCPHLDRTVQIIHELGCKAGVVIKPSTPIDLVVPFLDLIDLVLVLTVNPGYAGQAFLPQVLPKISALRLEMDKIDHPIWLEVDGGINSATLPLVRIAGANVFVSAKAIFNHPDGIASGIQELRSRLTN